VNYYNEIDPYAAEWLRNLIDLGEIPPGDVNTRSIAEVQGADLDGYRQCHFFSGIAGWPLALRLAGWPDDVPVWTGSCPCQPFSTAGKRKGEKDERHLWPEFFRLIRECRPPIVVGEQVPGAIRLGWLDGVFDALEGEGYACGAVVLPACGLGSPHIRQRLFWVADAQYERKGSGEPGEQGQERCGRDRLTINGQTDGLEHAEEHRRNARRTEPERGSVAGGCGACGVGDADGLVDTNDTRYTEAGEQEQSGGRRGLSCVGCWADSITIQCLDGKARRVPNPQSGLLPLAHGLPRSVGPGGSKLQRMELMAAKANRRGRLKGYGNAIVPQVAATFLKAIIHE